MSESSRSRRSAILFGVGLDNEDGHRRVTRGRDFLLVGGSEDTHGEMQERAVRFDEELKRRGKRLAEVESTEELREIADRAGM